MQNNKGKKVKIDGRGMRIAIVLSCFHEKLGLEMLKNAQEELKRHNVKNIRVYKVAGALELPFACKKIIQKYKPNAIVALGIVIEGKTKHFDLVCETTYKGLMKVQLGNGIPIAFGVLACKTEKQAKERVSKKGLNKGMEAVQAVLIQTKI
ncbi:MAG: 6,7-dimethyl-8-ribityllumazine synthase [Candidatus Gracilibacteria bacterium]|jgi:6,7-dimethyl-8-ribityllumazine synthase